MLDLPPDFTQTIQNTFGKDGKRWLAFLPSLLDEASRRWNLTDIQPVSNLSYNYVAFARKLPSPSGTGARKGRGAGGEGEVVLKLGVPNRELTSEIAALQLYNGHGAVQLLGADPEKGMLLLERFQPGGMLFELEDDEQATHIAADVMS